MKTITHLFPHLLRIHLSVQLYAEAASLKRPRFDYDSSIREIKVVTQSAISKDEP